MINLDLGGNGETHVITDEIIHEAIDDLDNNAQKVNKNIFNVFGLEFE